VVPAATPLSAGLTLAIAGAIWTGAAMIWRDRRKARIAHRSPIRHGP
jgi:hypothetical protein